MIFIFDFTFFFNSILLGVGLAMDAFSVSLANGLNEPKMKGAKMFAIAGIFSLLQFLMPLIGWLCIHTVAEHFALFEKAVPYIALVLLSYIGIHMIIEGIKIGFLFVIIDIILDFVFFVVPKNANIVKSDNKTPKEVAQEIIKIVQKM